MFESYEIFRLAWTATPFHDVSNASSNLVRVVHGSECHGSLPKSAYCIVGTLGSKQLG